jgi:hypothetical protein
MAHHKAVFFRIRNSAFLTHVKFAQLSTSILVLCRLTELLKLPFGHDGFLSDDLPPWT